jgi:hypothetical protein
VNNDLGAMQQGTPNFESRSVKIQGSEMKKRLRFA